MGMIIIILASLFIMTLFIVIGIVKTIKGQESKKYLITGMFLGVIPVIFTAIIFFQYAKGLR